MESRYTPRLILTDEMRGGWIHHRRQFPVRLLCFGPIIRHRLSRTVGYVMILLLTTDGVIYPKKTYLILM